MSSVGLYDSGHTIIADKNGTNTPRMSLIVHTSHYTLADDKSGSKPPPVQRQSSVKSTFIQHLFVSSVLQIYSKKEQRFVDIR